MRFKILVTKPTVILLLFVFKNILVLESKEPGQTPMKSITRNELYLLMQGQTITKKLDCMEENVLSHYKDDITKKAEVKCKLSKFKYQFKKKWQAAHKTKAVFEKNNRDWLNSVILLPDILPNRSSEVICVPSGSGFPLGRPHKTFIESSERTKRRKTKDLRSKELSELTYATQMKLRECGKVDASNIVKDLQTTPTRARKYKEAYKRNRQSPPQQLSLLRSLSMIADAGLSKAQYEIVRETNPTFYPCYTLIQKAKKDSYPSQEAYKVTETCAEIDLQDLVDNTATRLIMHLGDSFSSLTSEQKKSLVLISKWGCDGSQQAQYKMKFENDTDSDANIFQSSMVPLQLICGKDKKIIWQNPTPSSPRYCRPIRMRFIHETSDITKEEISYINDKIKDLTVTKFNDAHIKHKMVLTMVDGKVCNAATHTKSTMRCYLCDATSTEFNDLSKTRPIKEENLSFGLSLLHARIRFFESMLHVAYKLPVKKWNKRLTPEENSIVKKNKKKYSRKVQKRVGTSSGHAKNEFREHK